MRGSATSTATAYSTAYSISFVVFDNDVLFRSEIRCERISKWSRCTRSLTFGQLLLKSYLTHKIVQPCMQGLRYIIESWNNRSFVRIFCNLLFNATRYSKNLLFVDDLYLPQRSLGYITMFLCIVDIYAFYLNVYTLIVLAPTFA